MKKIFTKKVLIATLVSVSIFLLTTPMAAEAAEVYDLADYMASEHGQWMLHQQYDPLDPSGGGFLLEEELGGLSVHRLGPFTLHAYYRDAGQPGNWILEDLRVYLLTPDYVIFLGIIADGKFWLLYPLASIPRSMELEKPFVYSGVFTDSSEMEHFTASFTISNGGIVVSTDAGVFSDCIQVEWHTSVGAESGRTEIEIMAPGAGTVKRWTSYLWRVQEGHGPAAFEADTEYHEAIDYGSSDPPFPALTKLLGDAILSKILANDLYR